MVSNNMITIEDIQSLQLVKVETHEFNSIVDLITFLVVIKGMTTKQDVKDYLDNEGKIFISSGKYSLVEHL